MESQSTTIGLARQRSFLLWLAMAVLLHGLLLLLPDGRQLGSQAVLKSLSVTLSKPLPPPEHPVPVAETSVPSTTATAQPVTAPPVSADPEPLDSLAEPIEPLPAPRLNPQPPPSAARLLEGTRDLSLPMRRPDSTSRLGRHSPMPAPPNWQSGRIPGDSRLDGRELPDRVEIVDRWLAADGSHHVLVETPSGDMYCGRAAPWDPMQPLVEPVMMFRACGNGRKTFEWPDEYRRDRDGASRGPMER